MKPPVSYYFALSTSIGTSEMRAYLQLYDEDHQAVGPCKTFGGTSFCMTWKDIVCSIEQYFTEQGGVLNAGLNRPSPFVDLT